MTSPPRFLPYGDRAVLVELASPAAVTSLLRALQSHSPAGVIDLVPGAITLLVHFDPAVLGPRDVAMTVERALGGSQAPPIGRQVTIPVRYDGEDLADVAGRLRLSVDEVVARHAAALYTVAFCGFTPGFAYLDGLDPRLHLPRRNTPRTAVPGGAVAIAAQYSSIYPRQSPGGWHLLGRTDVPLWDPAAEPPTLLTPGTAIRFEPAR